MRRFVLTSSLAVMLALPAAAQDAPYSTEQLVDFFVNSVEMGASRGICIGTPDECAPAEAPKGLDMLVTFELDSADLTAEARQNLVVFAQMMQDERLEVARFVVEGHTDARGTEGYNLELSEARAEAVKTYLAGLGISPERLTAIGFGMAKPRKEDLFDPENRRVELRVDLR
jgi:outer membrane protein OmpA-like peptidoglycan-associated protein